jgi:flavin-dependent dehydrogenase
MKEFDVAIVGGGLAGGLLARQLRLSQPTLEVGLFEKSAETSYKVGEATVEIAANYLTRRLRLTGYLYENHLPKNGLRYFFDTPDRQTPLEEMSEMGSVSLPFHPAFQLDRARLEADLLDMNRRDGVHVRTEARVHGIALGTSGAPHRFEVEDGSGSSACSARWLVDASGRTSELARKLDLRTEEESHRIGSVWGRFENVTDIDSVGSDEFGARIRHTSRRLSTTHFWYRGYWVWFIPLRGGITSVGVTGRTVSENAALRTPEGFRAFLDEHAAISSLLRDAKLVDLGSYARIAYGTRRFFHRDRWGLTGEAATAADPLYSPGSDFIALENDFLTDLIRRDREGEEEEGLAERVELYEQFMQFRHEAAMLLYRGLYDTLGSYELARVKWDFDIGCYYNLWVAGYMTDQHLDADELRAQLRLRPYILQALRNFSDLFLRVASELDAEGRYYRENLGHFYHGLTHIDFAEEIGTERSAQDQMDTNARIFNLVRSQAAGLLGLPEAESQGPLPLSAFLGKRPIL